jgi:hypothetical protein
MGIPPPAPRAPASPYLELTGPTERRTSAGQLFTLALLKAGRDCGPCEACRILKRIIDEMEKSLEPPAGADPG